MSVLVFFAEHLTLVALASPIVALCWDASFQAAAGNARHFRRFGYAIHLAAVVLFIGTVLRATDVDPEVVTAAWTLGILGGAMLPINSMWIKENDDGTLASLKGPRWSRLLGVALYGASVYLSLGLDALAIG